MPILSAQTGRLRELGFRETASGLAVPALDTTLPSWDEMTERIGSQQLSRTAKLDYEIDYQSKLVGASNLGGRIALGSIFGTVGVPEGMESINPREIGASIFDGAFDYIHFGDNDLAVKATFGSAMKPVLKAGVNAVGNVIADKMADIVGPAVDIAMNMVGAIPIAGWVIRIGYAFGKAIKGLIDITRATQQREIEFKDEWGGYSPVWDLAQTNSRVYAYIGASGKDLTAIFSPPGRWDRTVTWDVTGDGFSFTKLKDPKGWRIMSRSRDEMYSDQNWLGVIPGGNAMHIAIECSKDAKAVTDYGRMFPTVTNQTTYLWGQVNQPTSLMYSVNAPILRERWIWYLWHMRKAIVEFVLLGENPSGQDRPPPKWAEAVINYMADTVGWARWLGEEGERIADPRDEDVWKLNSCIPVQAIDTLEENQRRLSTTLLCAYAGVDQAAFKQHNMFDSAAVTHDPAIWSRILKARSRLVNHPARCLIDLDNVQDYALREAIESSGCPPKYTLLNVQPFVADMPKVKLPTQEPKIPTIELQSAKRAGGGGGGGIALLALGAVGIGAAAFAMRGKK